MTWWWGFGRNWDGGDGGAMVVLVGMVVVILDVVVAVINEIGRASCRERV